MMAPEVTRMVGEATLCSSLNWRTPRGVPVISSMVERWPVNQEVTIQFPGRAMCNVSSGEFAGHLVQRPPTPQCTREMHPNKPNACLGSHRKSETVPRPTAQVCRWRLVSERPQGTRVQGLEEGMLVLVSRRWSRYLHTQFRLLLHVDSLPRAHTPGGTVRVVPACFWHFWSNKWQHQNFSFPLEQPKCIQMANSKTGGFCCFKLSEYH